MRLFACPNCGECLFFHNLTCSCGQDVAYDPASGHLVPADSPCANREAIGCNWRVSEVDGNLCHACAMTEAIPDTLAGENAWLWAEAELAKRWVLANLGRWGWLGVADRGPLPTFRLLGEQTLRGEVPVVMGHEDGVVTVNVTEADPVERVRRRESLGEPLRTMTGHFRHELGHFLFERLAQEPGFEEASRARFGDERADYAAALEAYYRNGPTGHWQERHVTAYASSHPHEDWAESFAHLLHLADIVDSAAATGVGSSMLPEGCYDAYADTDAERLIATGAKLGIALNHINRAMGISDIYPFVLTPTAREKLAFVHQWVAQRG